MKFYRKTASILYLVAFAVFLGFFPGFAAGNEKIIHKIFKNKNVVQINTFSGDCIIKIKKSPDKDIDVLLAHTYSHIVMEPQFSEEGSTLVLKEKLNLSGPGESKWTITLPGKIDIRFTSISGDFSVSGISGNIKAKTVSGSMIITGCTGSVDAGGVTGSMELDNLSGKINISIANSDLKIKQISGDISIKVANGDIEASKLTGNIVVKAPGGDVHIDNSTGGFEIKSASGDITADKIILKNNSYFKTASGDVTVVLADTTDFDLSLDSASGNVELNYSGFPIIGYFEFEAIESRGNIVSPFKFDKEEEQNRWGKKYLIKSFKREVEFPKVYLRTASGKATLKEK